MPGVARADEVIDGGLDGLARVGIGRGVLDAGLETVEGVGELDADVVGAGLFEEPGGELVAGERLDFVGNGDRVFAFGVLLQFVALDAVDADVYRDVIAVEQFEAEVDELRFRAAPFEAVPIFVGIGLDLGRELGGDVRRFVAGGPEGMPKFERIGRLPGVVGFGFEVRGDAEIDHLDGGRGGEFQAQDGAPWMGVEIGIAGVDSLFRRPPHHRPKSYPGSVLLSRDGDGNQNTVGMFGFARRYEVGAGREEPAPDRSRLPGQRQTTEQEDEEARQVQHHVILVIRACWPTSESRPDRTCWDSTCGRHPAHGEPSPYHRTAGRRWPNGDGRGRPSGTSRETRGGVLL